MRAALLRTARRATTRLPLRYAALALGSLFFWLYLTFPYDALKRRIVSEAAAAGWNVSIGSVGPGLFSVTLRDVRFLKSQGESALTLPVVSLRPSLFPLGASFRAEAFGGTVNGAVGGLSKLTIDLDFDDLDPQKGNLTAFTGLNLQGKVAGQASLTLPKGATSGDYDFSLAKGSIRLSTDKLLLKGGTLVVPMYGQPTPLDLPQVAIGNFRGRVVIDKGLATLEDVHSQSEDLELLASGNLKLNRRIDYSELNVEVKLKADPAFVKRLGLLGAGLSVLPTDRDNPAFRTAKINGYLGRPNFAPGR